MRDDARSTERRSQADLAAWKETVTQYQKPATWRALWQIVNTLGPYSVLWYLMYRSLAVSWWIVAPLAILAGAFLVRVFIIHHDCGHGSFFKSRKANNVLGFITGALTFTPYHHWRWEHALHHASSGDLDRRGTGDIWTLTVQEYLESSCWKRFAYRLARNPFVLFVLAPLFVFLVKHRFPDAKASLRERSSVYWTNLAVLGMAIGLSCLCGIKAYLFIQLTVLLVAGSAGLWLFYVQHQFDGGYCEGGSDWDYTAAALQGSSFYKLPRILQWFTGNIGYHHIHHLSARIPNYNLERCHQADPLFQQVKPLGLFSSFKSLSFRFWDEANRKLVGYRHLRELRKQRKQN